MDVQLEKGKGHSIPGLEIKAPQEDTVRTLDDDPDKVIPPNQEKMMSRCSLAKSQGKGLQEDELENLSSGDNDTQDMSLEEWDLDANTKRGQGRK
jgi:hypothetical protein